MLINSHAIVNVHEACARAVVEEVICGSLDDTEFTAHDIGEAMVLARKAGLGELVDDIQRLGKELNVTGGAPLPEWMRSHVDAPDEQAHHNH